ncbi:MAG: HNH endonuclease [Candidatus Heimdallarchaeaceae archaeon]
MDNRICVGKYVKKFKEKNLANRKAKVYIRKMKCLYCGKVFEVSTKDFNRGRGKYCSECVSRYVHMKGRRAPNWKGGRRKSVDGYVLLHRLLVPDGYHYLEVKGNGYVHEHRLAMAKKIGRKLKPDELVHHLNGIRDDNRIENLAITDRSNHEHFTFRKILQERIRELEKNN